MQRRGNSKKSFVSCVEIESKSLKSITITKLDIKPKSLQGKKLFQIIKGVFFPFAFCQPEVGLRPSEKCHAKFNLFSLPYFNAFELRRFFMSSVDGSRANTPESREIRFEVCSNFLVCLGRFKEEKSIYLNLIRN